MLSFDELIDFIEHRIRMSHIYQPLLIRTLVDNEAIFKRILDDEEFRQVLMDLYASRVYRRARETG